MQQWIRVLDMLESQLVDSLPGESKWIPPEGLGGMPAVLRERAAWVATAQAEAMAVLQESLSAAAADLATAVPARRSPSAIYLDVMG